MKDFREISVKYIDICSTELHGPRETSCLWKTRGQTITILCVFSLSFHPFQFHITSEETSVRNELHNASQTSSWKAVVKISSLIHIIFDYLFSSSIKSPVMWSMVWFPVYVFASLRKKSDGETWVKLRTILRASGLIYHCLSLCGGDLNNLSRSSSVRWPYAYSWHSKTSKSFL
jgi:hypothetical protein